ncbi:MAG: HEAT repeat domain-containing protein [Myxococcales bacterium]|nr:HEAT repeat domain-containing protein [Myxococcales bacterium]
MSRTLAVATACLMLCIRTASADTIATNVDQLSTGSTYKVRLAAALALSKSKDARAVIAVADALESDADPTIRRVAALALEKMIDPRTPDDAKELSFTALEKAVTDDRDAKVRDTAASTLKALSGIKRKKSAAATRGAGKGPPVFVQIDKTTDQSNKLPADASERVMKIVKSNVERTGYATTWPAGGLPTAADLSSARSRGFIVASTVKKLDITKAGGQTQIACTVAIRVAPWQGKDGGEKWEANKAASASGSAKATTGSRDRDIQGGVRDCIEAVAEDVTSRQVVPFLKRIAAAGS